MGLASLHQGQLENPKYKTPDFSWVKYWMASSKLISLKFVLVLSFSLHFSSSLVTSQAFFEVEVVLFVGAWHAHNVRLKSMSNYKW